MLPINHQLFFDGYRRAFGPLTQDQVIGLEAMLVSIEQDEGFDDDDLCAVAYMLATVKHECADTWRPIEERGERHYFDQYEPGTEKGRRLGNTEPGDGYRFRGRGYVQLTGRANYARMSDILGQAADPWLSVECPGQACIHAVAYAVLAIGMRGGLFTGKKLSDYCQGRVADYVGARRIVNGTDQAHRIAEYATQFERLLQSATEMDPGGDELIAVPTPLPSQIPTPPIYIPPPPIIQPPARSLWRRIWGGA